MGTVFAAPLLTVFMVHLGWRGMVILTAAAGESAESSLDLAALITSSPGDACRGRASGGLGAFPCNIASARLRIRNHSWLYG